MESSDDRDTAPDATNPSETPDDARLDQAEPSDERAAATDISAGGAEDAPEQAAEASAPWYPVVEATTPVTSAVEPVPGSDTPVSTEAASVPVNSPEPSDGAAEGPFWPAAPASTETPAAETPETEAANTSSAADILASGEAVATEAPTETNDPAASSGAWPEPPTPWADTGAMAAIAALDATDTTDTTEAPQAETLASASAASPDVSDLPTVIHPPAPETPPAESSAVDVAPPLSSEPPPVDAAPPSEPPPAYTPPPPPPAPEYAAPAQPLAPSGYVAPQPVAGAYVAPQVRPRDTTPVIVEAILAFFGFYGIGWLISGETTTGVILLIAGFVWDAIFIAAAFTVIGLCCVVPLQLIFVALSAFQLNNRLRMRG